MSGWQAYHAQRVEAPSKPGIDERHAAFHSRVSRRLRAGLFMMAVSMAAAACSTAMPLSLASVGAIARLGSHPVAHRVQSTASERRLTGDGEAQRRLTGSSYSYDQGWPVQVPTIPPSPSLPPSPPPPSPPPDFPPNPPSPPLPSLPPSPPPPLPLPPPPGWANVVSLVCSGTIDDITTSARSQIASNFAAAAGVSTNEVDVSVSAGSVRITVTITTSTQAGAEAVQSNLLPALASAGTATALMPPTVTVEAAPTLIVSMNKVPAPPPAAPPGWSLVNVNGTTLRILRPSATRNASTDLASAACGAAHPPRARCASQPQAAAWLIPPIHASRMSECAAMGEPTRCVRLPEATSGSVVSDAVPSASQTLTYTESAPSRVPFYSHQTGALSGLTFGRGQACPLGTHSCPSRAYCLVLSDLDDDGDLDLLSESTPDSWHTGRSNIDVRVHLNQNGVFTPLTIGLPQFVAPDRSRSAGPCYAADFDGDGLKDILLGGLNPPTLYQQGRASGSRYWSPNANLLGALPLLGTPTPGVMSVASGDVDGDGRLDLLVGLMDASISNAKRPIGYRGLGVALLLATGSAPPYSFSTIVQAPFASACGSGVLSAQALLGDMDGDGALDVVCAGETHATVLLNTRGDGTDFARGAVLTGWSTSQDPKGDPFNPCTEVALGDLNGDGALDMVMSLTSGANRVYLNIGNGSSFTNVATGFAETTPTFGISIADLDSDGDLDLFFAQAAQGQANEVWLNDGSAAFSAAYSKFATESTAAWVQFGDLNGDGALDAITASYDDMWGLCTPPLYR